MNALAWVQFSVGAFSAILQQLILLKSHGVTPSVAAPAIVEHASSAPDLTDAHKAVIRTAATAAQSIAEMK